MPSYYEALPIFRAAMDRAVRVDAAVQRFPKGHKYALGTKPRDASADVMVLVARSNRRAGARAGARGALRSGRGAEAAACSSGRRCTRSQSFKEFAEVMEQVVALARQAEAWRRSTRVPRTQHGRSRNGLLLGGSRDRECQTVNPCGPSARWSRGTTGASQGARRLAGPGLVPIPDPGAQVARAPRTRDGPGRPTPGTSTSTTATRTTTT